jgi:hypothetical protein
MISAVILSFILLLGSLSGCKPQAIPSTSSASSVLPSLTYVTSTPTKTQQKQTESQDAIYNKAMQALKDNRAIVAYSLFARLGDYKDSRERVESLRYVLTYTPITFVFSKYVSNAGKIVSKDIQISDSQIISEQTDTWSHINTLTNGSSLALGLKDDGTLSMIGKAGTWSTPNLTVPPVSK